MVGIGIILIVVLREYECSSRRSSDSLPIENPLEIWDPLQVVLESLCISTVDEDDIRCTDLSAKDLDIILSQLEVEDLLCRSTLES